MNIALHLLSLLRLNRLKVIALAEDDEIPYLNKGLPRKSKSLQKGNDQCQKISLFTVQAQPLSKEH